MPTTPSDPVVILYVEDNDDLRATIALLLQGSGREVVTCANAEEALTAAAQQHFHIVVTDVSLPGMSGVELARRLLVDDPYRWIVLCSGYEFGEHIRQFGPNVRALAKPFEVEELEDLLSEIGDAIAAPGAG